MENCTISLWQQVLGYCVHLDATVVWSLNPQHTCQSSLLEDNAIGSQWESKLTYGENGWTACVPVKSPEASLLHLTGTLPGVSPQGSVPRPVPKLQEPLPEPDGIRCLAKRWLLLINISKRLNKNTVIQLRLWMKICASSGGILTRLLDAGTDAQPQLQVLRGAYKGEITTWQRDRERTTHPLASTHLPHSARVQESCSWLPLS